MIFDEIALGLRLRNVDEETIKQKVNQTLKFAVFILSGTGQFLLLVLGRKT